MGVITSQQCFSEDWQRINPDYAVYLPSRAPYHPEAADHTMVDYTPGGDLLAIWTSAFEFRGVDQSIAFSRSTDGGVSWSARGIVSGPGPREGQKSQWGFPVVSSSGRIYVFYNKSTGIGYGAFLECKYSDDDGHTWIDGGVEIPYRRTKWDHPDPKVQSNCIIWQKATRDSKGRQVVPLTHGTHAYVKPHLNAGGIGGTSRFLSDLGETRCEFLRFDNIDEGPDPKELELTWLPDDEDLVSVPMTAEPWASAGYSFCQEPGLVLLPDGRLFTEMRTANGDIWYTVSDDDGHTWRETEVLRYRDGGDRMLNPISPSPMYRFEDGRYLIFLQNHDGYGYGGIGPLDLNSRRPQFLAVGEYREGAHQPVWFSEPMLFCDTEMVGVFPDNMYWLSFYSSMTERGGRRILWYTDRKLFFLGRDITDEMLAGLAVPE